MKLFSRKIRVAEKLPSLHFTHYKLPTCIYQIREINLPKTIWYRKGIDFTGFSEKAILNQFHRKF